MSNAIFEQLSKLSFRLQHEDNQRNNTFNLDEKYKHSENIKVINEEIDKLLDEYNYRKDFEENIKSV